VERYWLRRAETTNRFLRIQTRSRRGVWGTCSLGGERHSPIRTWSHSSYITACSSRPDVSARRALQFQVDIDNINGGFSRSMTEIRERTKNGLNGTC